MSQIQLGERRECNADDRRRQREACSPSDFQREILELSFGDFTTKTNIKDLVLKEHRKLKNDENAVLTTAAMHPKLEFYYEYRKRIHEWHKNSIKNLKFKQRECTKNVVEPQFEPNDANDKGNSLVKKSKKIDRPTEINEFQREIMALSYEAFLNETNIRDIVSQDFQKQFKGTKPMTESDMEFGSKFYEKLRDQPKQWHKTSMTHLKFKKCECKRKKQFEDKFVATDVIETADFGCTTDFDSEEITVPNQQQIQLAALTVHAVRESQTICMTNLTSDAFESNPEQETNAEEHQGETFEYQKFSHVDFINLFKWKYLFVC